MLSDFFLVFNFSKCFLFNFYYPIFVVPNRMTPTRPRPINKENIRFDSDFYPYPTAELKVSVIIKVTNVEPPFRSPVTKASPAGNAN